MSRRIVAIRCIAATSLILIFGIGCGSGGGCGGMKPLPADPAPWGFPGDQLIEGGVQARITKPGMDKLSSTIPGLISKSLGGGFCALQPNDLINVLGQKLQVCEMANCNGSTSGCPAYIYFDSKDRPALNNPMPPFPPAAAGNQDNKDRILVTLNDGDSTTGNPPTLTVDATFDVFVPVDVDWSTIVTSGNCYLYAYDQHLGDNSQDPMHIVMTIVMNTDAVTGELTLHLQNLHILNLGLTTSGSGGICTLTADFADVLLNLVNGVLTSFIGDFIVNLLTPLIDNLLQSFLPKPLGLAGTLNTASLLASFSPPADANLEVFLVGGGYVKSSSGGLTLGVMSGLNSDRDQTTRSPGLTSEPSLCVPSRPTPELSMAPWMLPFNAPRKDYTLLPAGPFAGNPDPVDSMGNIQDVSIGISRTFLNLAGFHIYNSGTLCLAIGGSAIPQLNAGTLSVIIGSLGNIIEDRKAPLEMVLRPQTPINFTIGIGTMADPLLHIAINDMRIDFYAWIEERYVRIMTVGLDMNVGVNLTVTKGANGQAALQPMLSGIDAKNVTIRISNTDLLQEDPKMLAGIFPTLINIATGALGGAIKPFALPAVAGFSLDNVQLTKVQTSQDDFLGIGATIVAGGPAPLINFGNWQNPTPASTVKATAAVARLDVPKAEKLMWLAAKPSLTLELGAEQASGPTEWAWRIDGGAWRNWTQDPNPTISPDEFVLQGRHTVEVRSRVIDDWRTESEPQKLEVLIDSVPPEVHPAKDTGERIAFNGFDIVSETPALVYAWQNADGSRSNWTPDASLSFADVRRITNDGELPLTLFAKDEAGNVGTGELQVGDIIGFHGRTTNPPSAGCGSCNLGGANQDATAGGLAALFGLALLVFLRRRSAALVRRGAALVVFVALGLYASGCGCSDRGLQCSIDDDCAKLQCAGGQVASCQDNMCSCNPDVALGDVGRFSSMALDGPAAYVAAYNTTYGDLMIGHVTPPGIVSNWDFVDGVPDESPDVSNSHVRGGVMTKGDDVGRYASLQITPSSDPIIAYYDNTHATLKFASFGVIRWRNHVVDKGNAGPEGAGDDLGRYASMSLGPDGIPAIAYTALVQKGMSGMPEGQLRWAQAKTPNPQQTSDWTVTVLDARPLPVPMGQDGGVPDGGAAPAAPDPLLPESIAIMPCVARKKDGSPGIVYYDRTRGNLRMVEWDKMNGKFGAPVILDGEDAMGGDTGDVGLYPSLTYDDMDVAHMSYEDATHDNMLYVDGMNKTPEVVDDGYHPKDETTLDGLDSPVWHLVGDSSSIQTTEGQVIIAYQDSTTLQLRIAQRGMDGKWMLQTIAGHAMPYKGSYGFYANLRIANRQGVVSSYAINQSGATPLFYVEVFAVDLGLIM